MSEPSYERALILDPDLIEWIVEERRRSGAETFDEVWEGVLHVTPQPTYEHQKIVGDLFLFLHPIAQRRGGEIIINLGTREPGSGDKNYRAPDLMYITPEDKRRVRGSYIDAGPSAVFEVRSPRDETYEKKPFYAKEGVRELVVVDRDTLAVEVFRLIAKKLVDVGPDADGRHHVEALGVRLWTREIDGRPALFGRDDAAPGDPVRIH